jgi:hypothetical protein
MNELRLVEVGQRVRELARQPERARQRQRAGGKPDLEALAATILDDDGVRAPLGDELDRTQDAGEVQRGQELVLAAQPRVLLRAQALVSEHLQQHLRLVALPSGTTQRGPTGRAQRLE